MRARERRLRRTTRQPARRGRIGFRPRCPGWRVALFGSVAVLTAGHTLASFVGVLPQEPRLSAIALAVTGAAYWIAYPPPEDDLNGRCMPTWSVPACGPGCGG